MNREYYVWCLVDRYLSLENFSYREAFECAQRDVYEIPDNRKSLEALVGKHGFHVGIEKVKRGFSQKTDHFIKR